MTQIFLIILTTLVLAGCGSKNTPAPTPTPAPKIVELQQQEKPIIDLVPRADGHELKLQISNIPSFISQIEYELLYTAVDNGMEIEKGAGDTIKVNSSKVERNILLGTASCTNGCKYKYDAGITGGTLSLTLITTNGQISTFETQFTLKSGKDIKQNGNVISLSTENYSQPISNSKTNAYYLLIKNFGSTDNSAYSLFTSDNF